MTETIRTKRLELRPATMDDAEALFARLYSDPEVMRYSTRVADTDVATTREFLAKAIETHRSGAGEDFVVLLDGEIIGKCGVWRGNEIGFQIARDHWGKGFAREAAEAVMARAKARGLASLMADVDPRNARSLALLKTMGFVITREEKNTIQIAGEWLDSVYLEKSLA